MGCNKANERFDTGIAKPVKVTDEFDPISQFFRAPFREICLIVSTSAGVRDDVVLFFFEKSQRSVALVYVAGLFGVIPGVFAACITPGGISRFLPTALVEHEVAGGPAVEAHLPAPVVRQPKLCDERVDAFIGFPQIEKLVHALSRSFRGRLRLCTFTSRAYDMLLFQLDWCRTENVSKGTES